LSLWGILPSDAGFFKNFDAVYQVGLNKLAFSSNRG